MSLSTLNGKQKVVEPTENEPTQTPTRKNKKAKVAAAQKEPTMQPLMRMDSRVPTGPAWYQLTTLVDKVEGALDFLMPCSSLTRLKPHTFCHVSSRDSVSATVTLHAPADCFRLRQALSEEPCGVPMDAVGSRIYLLREARCQAQAGVQLVTDMPRDIYRAVKETGKGETAQYYFKKTVANLSDVIAGKFVADVIGNYELDKLVEAIFDLQHVLAANYDHDSVHYNHWGLWDSPKGRKCQSWCRLLGEVEEAMKKAQAKTLAAHGAKVVDGEFAAFW